MHPEPMQNVDTSLSEKSLNRVVDQEECKLFIELLTDIDTRGNYETLGSDRILEIAGKLE